MQNLQMTDVSTTCVLNPLEEVESRNVQWGTTTLTVLTIHKEVREIPNLGPTCQLCIHEALVILNSVSPKQFKVLQAAEYKLRKWRRHIFNGSMGCQNTSLQQLSIHVTICTSAWKFSCSYNAPPTPPHLQCHFTAKLEWCPFSHSSPLERSINCTVYGHGKILGRKTLHFCVW
jgi:hypothetical protein